MAGSNCMNELLFIEQCASQTTIKALQHWQSSVRYKSIVWAKLAASKRNLARGIGVSKQIREHVNITVQHCSSVSSDSLFNSNELAPSRGIINQANSLATSLPQLNSTPFSITHSLLHSLDAFHRNQTCHLTLSCILESMPQPKQQTAS